MTNREWLNNLTDGALAQCLEWNGNDAYMLYDEWFDWLKADHDESRPGWKWLEAYRESRGNYEVEKIVRCKDCKYWENSYTAKDGITRGDCEKDFMLTEDSFYCADGRRKDDVL